MIRPARMIRLPARELRRPPLPFEVAAGVDFEAMDRHLKGQRDSLIAVYSLAQDEQIAALVDQVKRANGDVKALAHLTAAPVPTDLLLPHLEGSAEEGMKAAHRERTAQLGPKAKAPLEAAAKMPDQLNLDLSLEEIAGAASYNLANGLAQSASARAATVAALPPEEAAANVASFLASRSDAAMKNELGGAVQHAYGKGRSSFMAANAPTAVFASELLDDNTCGECEDVDGTEYAGIEESENDYPYGGGYINCDGGLRCRGTVVAQYGEPRVPPETPTQGELPRMEEGPVPQGFHPTEVKAEDFHGAIAKALEGRNGKSLTDYSIEDYRKMRTFLADPGPEGPRVGGALKGDFPNQEIVSLFNLGGEPGNGMRLFDFLRDEGGSKLDCIGDHLRESYEAHGFHVTKTIKWDDQYAPEGWDYAAKGRPNIYEMEKNAAVVEPDIVVPPIRWAGIHKREIRPPEAPARTVPEVMAIGVEDRPKFVSLLDETTKKLGGRTVTDGFDNIEAKAGQPVTALPPMKEESHVVEKIARKEAEGKPYTPEDVTDVNRASLVVNDLNEIPAAFNTLREVAEKAGWELADYENGYLKAASKSGYRQLSVLARDPSGRQYAEIQLHVNRLWTARAKEGGHDLYDKLKTWAVKPEGPEREVAEAKLNAGMRKIYEPAWDATGWQTKLPKWSREWDDNRSGSIDLPTPEADALQTAQEHILAIHKWPTPASEEDRLSASAEWQPSAAKGSYTPARNHLWMNTDAGSTDVEMINTATHEMGHRLDDLLGREAGGRVIRGGETYGLDPGVQKVLDAANSYPAKNALDRITNLPSWLTGTDKWATYAMKPQEIFARAYTEFVAEKIGRKDVYDALDVSVEVKDQATGEDKTVTSIEIGESWDAIEFAAIRQAFEEMFAERELAEAEALAEQGGGGYTLPQTTNDGSRAGPTRKAGESPATKS